MLAPWDEYWAEPGVGALIVIDVLILTTTEGELVLEDSLSVFASTSRVIFVLLSSEAADVFSRCFVIP